MKLTSLTINICSFFDCLLWLQLHLLFFPVLQIFYFHVAILNVVFITVKVDDPRKALLKLEDEHYSSVAAKNHGERTDIWEDFLVGLS